MALGSDAEQRLRAWMTAQAGAGDVTIERLGRALVGHSAETLLLTIAERHGDRTVRRDVVLRLRPVEPALLPPYDLHRQFRILRCLESTAVRSPKVLWREPTGDVLGREFYVMERLPGTVFEQDVPEDLRTDPARIRRLCDAYTDQLAEIHSVDLAATGLDAIADGRDYLERDLAHWRGEIDRVRREPSPALERLHATLVATRPEHSAVTLVHGDAKPGNYAFVSDEVTAVFDWELATVGDPLADVGWAEVFWNVGDLLTNLPGAPTTDEFVARWEERTGLRAQRREWYRAMQAYKFCAIALVAGNLFDTGHTDDLRLASMSYAVAPFVKIAWRDLGIEEEIDLGPVGADAERMAAVLAAVDGPDQHPAA